LGDLSRVSADGWPPAGEVDRIRVPEVERRFLEVARDVDEDRAAAAGPGDVEGGLEHVRDLLDVLHEPGVLDDRGGHAGDVALLEGVGPDQVAPDLAGDADERRRVHPGVGDRGDEVGRTRARRGEGDADAAGRACVAFGHVPGTLLVAREHVPHGRPSRDRVVDGQDRAARDPEGDLDGLGLEGAEDCVGSVHAANSTSVLVVGISSSTASMKSRVGAGGALPAGSAVGAPEARAVETARSSVRPAACSPSPSESISAAASSIPLGLATPWPAMSGADPCVGPKMPGPDWDIRPEATIRESLRLAAVRSETSSACDFWVTTTQKPSGAFI